MKRLNSSSALSYPVDLTNAGAELLRHTFTVSVSVFLFSVF